MGVDRTCLQVEGWEGVVIAGFEERTRQGFHVLEDFNERERKKLQGDLESWNGFQGRIGNEFLRRAVGKQAEKARRHLFGRQFACEWFGEDLGIFLLRLGDTDNSQLVPVFPGEGNSFLCMTRKPKIGRRHGGINVCRFSVVEIFKCNYAVEERYR